MTRDWCIPASSVRFHPWVQIASSSFFRNAVLASCNGSDILPLSQTPRLLIYLKLKPDSALDRFGQQFVVAAHCTDPADWRLRNQRRTAPLLFRRASSRNLALI